MQYIQEDEVELPYLLLRAAQTLEYQVGEGSVHDLKEQDAGEQPFQGYPILQEFHFQPFS